MCVSTNYQKRRNYLNNFNMEFTHGLTTMRIHLLEYYIFIGVPFILKHFIEFQTICNFCMKMILWKSFYSHYFNVNCKGCGHIFLKKSVHVLTLSALDIKVQGLVGFCIWKWIHFVLIFAIWYNLFAISLRLTLHQFETLFCTNTLLCHSGLLHFQTLRSGMIWHLWDYYPDAK